MSIMEFRISGLEFGIEGDQGYKKRFLGKWPYFLAVLAHLTLKNFTLIKLFSTDKRKFNLPSPTDNYHKTAQPGVTLH